MRPPGIHRTLVGGMTLVEVLVAAAAIALLLLITDRVFTAVHIASRKVQLASDMQQNARVAASRLRREMRESSASLVICHPDPACETESAQVVFPSARPSDASSVFCIDVAPSDPAAATLKRACTTPIPLTGAYLPVWQRYIGYHRDPVGDLRRVVQTTPITLPMAAGGGQVVASAVDSFSVRRTAEMLRLRLRSRGTDRIQGGPVPAQEMMLEDVIELRNGAMTKPG